MILFLLYFYGFLSYAVLLVIIFHWAPGNRNIETFGQPKSSTLTNIRCLTLILSFSIFTVGH